MKKYSAMALCAGMIVGLAGASEVDLARYNSEKVTLPDAQALRERLAELPFLGIDPQAEQFKELVIRTFASKIMTFAELVETANFTTIGSVALQRNETPNTHMVPWWQPPGTFSVVPCSHSIASGGELYKVLLRNDPELLRKKDCVRIALGAKYGGAHLH